MRSKKINNESFSNKIILSENNQSSSRNKHSSRFKKEDIINFPNKKNLFPPNKNIVFYSGNTSTCSPSFNNKPKKKKYFLEKKSIYKMIKDFDYNTNNLNQTYTQKNKNSTKSYIQSFNKNSGQNIYINSNIINNKILINVKNNPNYTNFQHSPRNSIENIKKTASLQKMVKTNSFAVSKSHINNSALLNLLSKKTFNTKKRTNLCIYPNKTPKLNLINNEIINYYSPSFNRKIKKLFNTNDISTVEKNKFTYDKKIVNSSFTRKIKSHYNIAHNYEKTEIDSRNIKQKYFMINKTSNDFYKRTNLDSSKNKNIINNNIERQIYDRNIMNKMQNIPKKIKNNIYLKKLHHLKNDEHTNKNLLNKNSPYTNQRNTSNSVNSKKNIINISKKNEIIKKKFIFQNSQFLEFKKGKVKIKKSINKSISRKKLLSDLSFNINKISNNLKQSHNKKIFQYFEEAKQNIKKEKQNNSFDDKKDISKKTNTENKNLKPKVMSKISCISKDGEIVFGQKKINQDRFFDSDLINDFKFIGVCDGHGENGHYVSEYIKTNLPLILNEQLNYLLSYQKIKNNIEEKIFYIKKTKSNKNIKETSSNKKTDSKINTELFSFSQIKQILTKSFLYSNSSLLSKYKNSNTLQYSGSTCISLLFTPKNLNKIYISNLGDSRAIIIKEKNKYWTCKQLSRDHKPFEKDEAMRIYQNGGHIEKFEDEEGNLTGPLRVWDQTKEGPGLAMTRSFGDIVGSNIGIISVPEVSVYDVKKEDKAIIVASDGLWEHVSNKEVVEVVKKLFLKKSTEVVVNELYKVAYDKWKEREEGIDDTTIICVFLKNVGKKEK